MQKRFLVTVGGLLVITILLGLVNWFAAPVIAQGPTPQATAASSGPAAPIQPLPRAALKVLSVAANPAYSNPVTMTLNVMTDTAVGPYKSVIALGSSGLLNEPIGMPVRFGVDAIDPKNTGTPVWTLTKPTTSKAAIKDPSAKIAEFVPDVPGTYKLDVALKNNVGTGPIASVQVRAGRYIGVEAGNCKQCHATRVAEWQETGHARIMTENLDAKGGHYSETCIRCHTTGYTLPAKNGGFSDMQAQAGWKFPTYAQINTGGNWQAMPAQVKNMANIQCEDCHGPAKEHATTGAKVMDTSFDDGVCNVCHDGGGHHLKGTDMRASKHSDATAEAFASINGPSRQDCVRCHSGKGYVSFLADPINSSSWDNSMQTIGCTSCHDPHSDKNSFQLRIVGKPKGIPFEAKNAGLSATCEECHNSRRTPADAVKGSFPHYSSAAEFLNDTGGVTYGKTVANSPHGAIVGVAPVPNPDYAKDPTLDKYLFSVGNPEGNVPGPCVTCHMYPTIEDTKNAEWHKVGSHSFNMVSPDGKLDYTAACQSCHKGLADFNFKAKADYDGNGKVEGVQDEVKGLLDDLYKAITSTGVKKVLGNPYFELPQNADDKVKNAIYNYRTVYGVMWSADDPGNEGKAQAIHNFKRAVSLLQLSYKDLTGQDVPGATLIK